MYDPALEPEAVSASGITSAGWRIVAASVRGPSHEAANQFREDSFCIRIVADMALAVVCDGAGTACNAAAGAARFSKFVLEYLADFAAGSKRGLVDFRTAIVDGIEEARGTMEAENRILRDYAATLVCIAASRDGTLIGHVGDGLAGVAAAGDWLNAQLSAPSNGEYVNETYFVTEEGWQSQLRCMEAPALQAGGSAVVLTDGAEPFVISAGKNGLSPEFMGPVSRFLATGDVEEVAHALVGTLASATARRISSDDKTLIWIAPGEA